MADGDRFERRLCGRGWPTAYRLAASGESIEGVGDAIMTALAAGLRGPLKCESLSTIGDALHKALREHHPIRELNFEGPRSTGGHLTLARSLSQIVGSQPSVSAQLAVEAALSIHAELSSGKQSVDLQRVQNRLAEAFSERIVRYQWLDRVRDGIAENKGCSIPEQIAWDKKLLSQVRSRAQGMLLTLIRSNGQAVVRAPKRVVPRREMTMKDLHRGLRVLGR
jgi:hypothetical protein